MEKRRQPLILNNIELTTAGSKGVAIGRTQEGITVFVKNAVPGDIVNIEVSKKKKRFFEGKAISIEKESDVRIDAKCKHFSICGGCTWQNMTYEAQLHYKEKEVRDNLERIGKIAFQDFLPILGSKEDFFYRNKMEFTFSNQAWNSSKNNPKNALGFNVLGKWNQIIDIEKCWLQKDPSNAIRLEVKKYAELNKLEFFNPIKRKGFLRSLLIKTTTLGDVMVLIQFFRENKKQRIALLNHIKTKFPEIKSLLFAINSHKSDSVYNLNIQTFAGENFITEEMEGLKFNIGPKSFYQPNPKQALKLYNIARDFANLNGTELVYDLYTGTGTIAQFVAKKAKKVIGIESVQEAINSAKESAKRNKIDNCEFLCGDMKEVFTNTFVNQHGKPDVIITDPPRDGMHPKVIANILNITPDKIIYISCNSATQARDLALMKNAYDVVKVQPVDMFPQTYHVENVVLLKRKS